MFDRRSSGLILTFLVGVNAASHSASGVPWPKLPSPAPYSSPREQSYFQPVSVSPGLTSKTTNITSSQLTFNTVGDTYTIDYGVAVAGKPTFEVLALEDYAQIEVIYSEAYNGLESPQGDGPFAFANALAATFRVETFNITELGNITGYFIQGSQRWQSIKLVKGSGLTLGTPAFVSSIDTTPLAAHDGYFASSNPNYTDIWALGPRTEQFTCFAPGTQTATWDVTENGVYIRGQKPATTAKIVNLSNYTLAFDTMIDYGGTGWRVDTEIDAIQATGPIFVLTSEYPEGSFANIDRSLVPPNTLILGRGWSLQNQTSLPGYVLDKFPLKSNVAEKVWHKIETASHGDDTYTVFLNGDEIAHFNISSYGIGDPNPYIPGGVNKGFAFGPWQDQATYIRNVTVTSSSGQVLYTQSMTSPDTLTEYGVQTNTDIVQSDSGKRDRYSWMGDRLISSRSTLVSTSDGKCIWGPTLQTLGRQATSGQVPANTLFSPLDTVGALIRTINVDPLLVDYEFDFLQTIYNYWFRSGNDTIIRDNWNQMTAILSYAITRALDDGTQLYGAPNGAQGIPLSGEKGQALGPANTVSLILGLERMAEMATHLNDKAAAEKYRAQAQLSRQAIDQLLWNATGGYYSGSLGTSGYDTMDIAQVLLGEIGTAERRKQFLGKLDALKLPAGYSNGTRFADTPAIVNPYYMSFLLEGLAIANETVLAQGLLDDTWSPMVRRDVNYTGAYWEYVSPDGSYPGLDLFTGQSHYWGAYSTAFLTEYALGVRPIAVGYSQFLFAPLPSFKVEWVQGRVPTPHGLIYANWGYGSNGKIIMYVTAPNGTQATIIPPFPGKWTCQGKSGQGGNVTVTGTALLYEV